MIKPVRSERAQDRRLIMPTDIPPITYGNFYHIYHRGNNRENIFFQERNYRYFMELYIKYIPSIAETYAYCLLRNHFHLLVRIKRGWKTSDVSVTSEVLNPTQQFANFLNAYAKSI